MPKLVPFGCRIRLPTTATTELPFGSGPCLRPWLTGLAIVVELVLVVVAAEAPLRSSRAGLESPGAIHLAIA